MVKTLVWAAVAFGLYTAWCYLPAWRVPGHMASTVENIMQHADHTMADDTIREKTWKAAGMMDIALEKRDIVVSRSTSPGERSVDVRFQVPVTVHWLGQEKRMQRTVEASHVFPVNEAAEKARLDRIAENERIDRHNQRIAKAAYDDYQRRVKRECTSSNPNLEVTSVMVTMSDGERHVVPCDAARRW